MAAVTRSLAERRAILRQRRARGFWLRLLFTLVGVAALLYLVLFGVGILQQF